MKINSIILVTLLTLAVAATKAPAQTTPAPSPAPAPTAPTDEQEPPDRPPAPPWLKALDANADFTISADEINNASTALRTLDLNKDGVLTPDELHPKRPDGDKGDRPGKRERGPKGMGGPGGHGPKHGPGHRPPPPPVITALDADKDGSISTAEIEKAATALKSLDKNADGQLTGDEIHPPRPPRPPKDEDGGPEGEEPPPTE